MKKVRKKPDIRLSPGMLNVGPATTAWLDSIGIHTRDDLEKVGVIPACVAMRALGHPISVVGAYALQAALLDLPWQALPTELRAEVKLSFKHAMLKFALLLSPPPT